MEWSDVARILAVRPHGETSAIVDILTPSQGRHAGLVRGGRSKSQRPVLQPGNRVQVTWRARLADQLGNFQIEPDHLSAGALMEDPLALSGLNASCALAVLSLPEREVHRAVYDAFEVLIETLDDPDIWPALYVRWEAGLLSDLGYGLDLKRCAVTGVEEDLSHVSPRTGRAVCSREAEPYRDKLLALPAFLKGLGEVAEGDIAAGLALTGHFLERRVLWPTDRVLPEARHFMYDRLERAGRL